MENAQLVYLQGTRKLMCIIGQWPYQRTIYKTLISSVYLTVFVLGQTILQCGGMIAAWKYDASVFLENVAPFLVSLMCIVKLMNFALNGNKMRQLLGMMKDDWNMATQCREEIDILHEYYTFAMALSKGYAVCVCGSMAPFLMVPAIALTRKYIGLSNDTGDLPLLFHVEYFVDAKKHYYLLLLHSYVATLAFLAAVVSIDSMFVFYVQHACGIIAILGHRLKNVVAEGDVNVDVRPKKSSDDSLRRINACVALHNHILRYSKLIESANTVSFFLQLGLNMICISFTGFQAVMHLEKPDEAFRYGSFAIAQTFHLLYESLPAQHLYDHSIRICEYAASAPWYRASMRARMILNLIILRSLRPIELTAGKFYSLNLQNFSAVVRTSFSYFTVLCSMR